eukprot:4933245-Pleurochrysis_carterae.AAC.1
MGTFRSVAVSRSMSASWLCKDWKERRPFSDISNPCMWKNPRHHQEVGGEVGIVEQHAAAVAVRVGVEVHAAEDADASNESSGYVLA